MWINAKFFKYAAKLLIILIILFFILQLNPYLAPVFNVLDSIIRPLFFGTLLYYIFRPLVHYLMQHRVPSYVALTIVFLILATILAIIVTYIYPLIATQIQSVTTPSNANKVEEVKEATINLMNIFNLNLYSYAELKEIITNYMQDFQQFIFQNTGYIVATITKVAFTIILIPFVLFYFLRDDTKIIRSFLNFIPKNYRDTVHDFLKNIDKTLAIFINGQIAVALITTSLAFIPLLILRIDNLAFLVFVIFLLNLIPYLGTLLAIIPPVVSALTMNYYIAILTGICMISIHLIESNIITPKVMMKKLNLHPLTVILLIFCSFSVIGAFGPLIATPLYVVLREIVIQLMKYEKTVENEIVK